MIFIIVDIEMDAHFVNRGMSNTLKIKSYGMTCRWMVSGFSPQGIQR